MPPLLNAGSLLGFMREDIKEQLGIAYDIPFLIGGQIRRWQCLEPVCRKGILLLYQEQRLLW